MSGLGCQNYMVDPSHIMKIIFSLDVQQKQVKSFDHYRKLKTSKSENNKSKKPKASPEVSITIGLLKYDDYILKPVRGKRLALRVKATDGYSTILTKALMLWQDFCPEAYEDDQVYTLCFENGNETILMPGNDNVPFELKKYKEATGKDYKRIILYLCKNEDLDISSHPSKKRDRSDSDDDDDYDGEKYQKCSSSKIVKYVNIFHFMFCTIPDAPQKGPDFLEN